MASRWRTCVNRRSGPVRSSSRWAFLAALILLGANTPAFSAAPGKLDALPGQIRDAKRQLDFAEEKRADAELALERMDRELADYSNRAAGLREEIATRRSQLEHLSSENSEREKSLAAIRNQLGQVARAAHQLGRQPYLKILLSNEDVTSAGRSLAYYEYFIKNQSQHLEQLRRRLAESAPLARQMAAEQDELTRLLQEQETERIGLDRRRSERARLLARASAHVKDQRQLVQRLANDQARLERLTGELGRTNHEAKDAPPSPGTPFANLKGRLDWPVSGTVLARFGATHPVAAQQRSHGVLFGSTHGAPVHAVWAGRVVFADWLTGFGFMTIVDHGGGYLSLYGYNENNLKAVGDVVQANDIIGRVGASGWLEGPALYFEIRFEGKPINPSPWLAKR